MGQSLLFYGGPKGLFVENIKSGDVNTIHSNYVYKLRENNNLIYVSVNELGLEIYSNTGELLKFIDINNINNALFINDDNIFVGTKDYYCLIYDKSGELLKSFSVGYDIHSIFSDGISIYIGTGQWDKRQVKKYNFEGVLQWQRLTGINNTAVRCIVKSSNGNVIMSVGTKIMILDDKTGSIIEEKLLSFPITQLLFSDNYFYIYGYQDSIYYISKLDSNFVEVWSVENNINGEIYVKDDYLYYLCKNKLLVYSKLTSSIIIEYTISYLDSSFGFCLFYSNDFYLIKTQDNKIQAISNDVWVDTGLIEPLTEQNFRDNQMKYLSIITPEQWAELGDSFEILHWTDYDAVDYNPKLQLTVPEYQPITLLPSPTLLTWTDTTSDLQVMLNADVETKVRFLVSKDNRVTWFTFKDSTFTSCYITDILDQGMDKITLESITQLQWKEWFQRGTLDFAVGILSQNPNESPVIQNITVNFPENEAPLIVNPKYNPSTIHRDTSALTALIQDQEADYFKYQILINNKVFKDWITINQPEYNLIEELPWTVFNAGDNTVTLVVKDSRGAERNWTANVILINNEPFIINLAHSDFSFTAHINDEDADEVAYRVLINGVKKYPEETEWSIFDVPRDISFEWDSGDLIFNQPNTVRIEVKDRFGAWSYAEFEVIGTYKGLMFVDKDGNYYSTDKGDLLSYLDFGDIIAGTQVEPKIVYLKNQNGYDVGNLKIFLNSDTLAPLTDMFVSKTLEPFDHLRSINFTNTLQNGEEIAFYVKLVVDILAQAGGIVEIYAKGDPVL